MDEISVEKSSSRKIGLENTDLSKNDFPVTNLYWGSLYASHILDSYMGYFETMLINNEYNQQSVLSSSLVLFQFKKHSALCSYHVAAEKLLPGWEKPAFPPPPPNGQNEEKAPLIKGAFHCVLS